MTWQRPVPLVGDTTSAAQRAADPGAWAFPEPQREALQAILRARRDVRRFRPDPIPEALLRRLLAAAHTAPSVGHSQPWRFVVVQDAAIREQAALLADRERLRQAAQLEPDAARRLLDLKLEGVREAPLGVVVCCDRRTPAAGVLGRATFPDADLWSCAAAIQNLWLTARAEGLGLGWVTLFRPDELAKLIGLPDGVQTLGWLCLGWPDEHPPDPGLERAGWSRRMPLDQVWWYDQWPSGSEAPQPPPSKLRAPGPAAVVAATDDADRLLTTPGSLGVLDRALDRIVSLGQRTVTSGTLVIAAADHPVAGLGVSAYPSQVTWEVFRAAEQGEALGVACARAAGLSYRLADATAVLRDPRGDLATSDGMSEADARRLLDLGRSLGAAAAEDGLVALGEIGIGNTTVAACLAAALLGATADEVTGLGAGADSAILERKRSVIAAALDRATSIDDPLRMLAALGGPEFAVLTGVVLGAAAGGAAVVLDGLATSVAALLAVRMEPAAAAHLVAGQRSRERAHELVLTELGCEPLLDLRIRAGEGAGAALAAGLLLQGLQVRRTAARVDR